MGEPKLKYFLNFYPKDNLLKETSRIKEARSDAANAVFLRNIVVSNGKKIVYKCNAELKSNTVECYDVSNDK